MRKSNRLRKLQSIVFACAFCFAIVFSISVYSFVKLGEVRRASVSYTRQMNELQKQKDKLQDEVDYMKTDKYIEDQARDNLGMIKDGETLYVYGQGAE